MTIYKSFYNITSKYFFAHIGFISVLHGSLLPKRAENPENWTFNPTSSRQLCCFEHATSHGAAKRA